MALTFVGITLSAGVFVFSGADLVPGEPPRIDFHAHFCDALDLQRLMDEGEDPNKLTDGGSSAVWKVIRGVDSSGTGCLRSLQALVDAGGSIDRTENGFSALGAAATSAVEPGLVEYLGELGADPCLPLEEHVDLDSRRILPSDNGLSTNTLLELARRNSTEAAVSEFEDLLARCD